uniref:Complex I-B14 n=1 Tax=Meloidogyne javanica TaxID=6303 RepID=A0A915LGY6_MELJA
MSTSNTGAVVSRMVRPIISQDLVEAKLNVLKMYKQFQRVAKQHWWDYKARQHLVALKYFFYNEYHVRNMLFAENIEPKPKDFLSKFLHGKD